MKVDFLGRSGLGQTVEGRVRISFRRAKSSSLEDVNLFLCQGREERNLFSFLQTFITDKTHPFSTNVQFALYLDQAS